MCKVIIDGKGEVPTRMKFGLNIGMNSGANLPTNICFNANVPNENEYKTLDIYNRGFKLILRSIIQKAVLTNTGLRQATCLGIYHTGGGI